MTREYNVGKRASQIPPFRLYVFASILFFFLTFLEHEKYPPTFNANASNGANAGFTINGEPVAVKEAWDAAIEQNRVDPETKEALEAARDMADELTEKI